MVWGAFSYSSASGFAAEKGRVNSPCHSRILEGQLAPMNALSHDGSALFQQDNARIRISYFMRGWFDAFDLLALEWPPRSPDLNPIEDLWGWMARRVYAGAWQHKDREELLESVMKRWPEIDQDCLEALSRSMKKRCLSAIKAKGSRTDC